MNFKKAKTFLSYNTPEAHLPFRFEHKAMHTVYEIRIGHADKEYAQQAASEAFSEIDRLELELSRFNTNSDISRINALKQYESITLGNDCYQCMEQCSRLYQQTKGIFDISSGFIVDLWKILPPEQQEPAFAEIESALRFCGMPWLHLLTDFQVQLMSEKISLDLGGFGKGYALQVVGDLLKEWEVNNGLISAGMSSMMPLHKSVWPVEIKHPEKPEKVLQKIELHEKSVSGSGIRKGQHIVDPRNGQPVTDKIAAWAISENPATSDALSTAFMIMSIHEINAYCEEYNTSALIITLKEKIIKIGRF